MNKASAALLIAVTALSAGCGHHANDSSIYRFIGTEGWNYGDTLIFEPAMADSAATGSLVLSLSHTNGYIYSNLYLEVTVADSLTTYTDTLNITLADEFGRWYGRGIGTDFQIADTVSPEITLRRPVTVGVRHVMRTDNLRDIERIGITFTEKAENGTTDTAR